MAIVTMEYVDTFWCALVDDLGRETERVEAQREVTGDRVIFRALAGIFVGVAIYRGSTRYYESLRTMVQGTAGDTIQITLDIRKYEGV
jgi:hypothetical protein